MNLKISKFITWQFLRDYIYVIDERCGRLFFLEDMSKDVWIAISNLKNKKKIVSYFFKQYQKHSEEKVEMIINDFIEELIAGEFIYEEK